VPVTIPKPLQGRLGMAVQIVSLLATGVIIWNSVVGPRLLRQPLSSVAGHALLYAALAWFWSAAITLCLYLVLPRAEAGRMVWSTLRTSAVAVWFAPACILLSQLSPVSLLAALALVVAATRLLYSEWLASSPPAAPVQAVTVPAVGMFRWSDVRPPVVTRELSTGISAALALQFGVVSVWKHQPLFAGFWFVLSAAVITLFAMVSGAMEHAAPPSLPRSALGILATVLLAAGITVGGIHMVRRGGGFEDGSSGSPAMGPAASARDVLKQLFGDKTPGQQGGPAPHLPPDTAGIARDGSFPGVILWPEVRPVARLVAPLPAGASEGIAFVRPYSIPFDGKYLLYRWPFLRPPGNSILERGNPAALAFSTTDHWPLNMDAVQQFDQPIDLRCCSRVRIEIWNADRFPGTVSLDLYADGKLLGSAPVRSTPDLKHDPVVAVPETLDFPTYRAEEPCKELKIVFQRARVRMDKSARISIERFVLVP
jgi:hypothetical protein